MKSKKYSSSQDYAAGVIKSIVEADIDLPVSEQLDPRLLTYWCEEITSSAHRIWKEYKTGDRYSYKFTEEEMEDLFEKAKYRMISEVLEELLEKDLVQIGVRADGELVYKLSETGQNYLKQRL